MKFNKSEIMSTAWKVFKNESNNVSFSEALKLAWMVAKDAVKDNEVTKAVRWAIKKVKENTISKYGHSFTALDMVEVNDIQSLDSFEGKNIFAKAIKAVWAEIDSNKKYC